MLQQSKSKRQEVNRSSFVPPKRYLQILKYKCHKYPISWNTLLTPIMYYISFLFLKARFEFWRLNVSGCWIKGKLDLNVEFRRQVWWEAFRSLRVCRWRLFGAKDQPTYFFSLSLLLLEYHVIIHLHPIQRPACTVPVYGATWSCTTTSKL